VTTIDRKEGRFIVDAAVLARAFSLSQTEIRVRMREGVITSRCETGADEDAGRFRLTFYHRDRACRLIVDETGKVLTRATFPVQTRPGANVTGPDAEDAT